MIGRSNFESAIGSVGFATAELLARSFPVSFLPTEEDARREDFVTLPNGRRLPVCRDPARIEASVFCDVLWNGIADLNWTLAPAGSLKYAWLTHDSDRLPPRAVELLNTHFDLVIAASPHQVELARVSGVESPVAVLPLPLELEGLLLRPLASAGGGVVRFGSVAAFHPRKGNDVLVEAFLSRFAGRDDRELVLHSNLAFGPVVERVQTMIDRAGAQNVRVSHGWLSHAEKEDLIRSFDVFVSCSRGEGYSIGPREALACGKVVVASKVGGHQDLDGVPGVFLVEPELAVPARYPEIDNLVFGEQRAVAAVAVGHALEAALEFVGSPACARTAQDRRNRAREWSFSRLAGSMAALIDPSIGRYRAASPPLGVSVPPEFERVVDDRLGRRADRIGGVRRQVCEAYDAGFFSIFNSFMSHLVWQEREDRCHAVLPDWNVERLDRRLGGRAKSFCYGQPGDGNLWLKLFAPLFGATDAEMQDEDWLWRHAEAPAFRHNEKREPLLTYTHAYKLYQSRDFEAWRRQYHRVLSEQVRLRPELQAEIDAFAAAHLATPVLIAAHVRHPSHTVEQPGGRIAHTETYIERVRDEVRKRGADPNGPGWAVFVATDQDRVLHRFRAEFGDRAVFYPEARRTRADEDAAFDALTPEQQNREGHQLQHLVAADRENWNWRMAWEVVRDAYTMARCDCLLHVVSNVSTAVAYMNPRMEMVFCPA